MVLQYFSQQYCSSRCPHSTPSSSTAAERLLSQDKLWMPACRGSTAKSTPPLAWPFCWASRFEIYLQYILSFGSITYYFSDRRWICFGWGQQGKRNGQNAGRVLSIRWWNAFRPRYINVYYNLPILHCIRIQCGYLQYSYPDLLGNGMLIPAAAFKYLQHL